MAPAAGPLSRARPVAPTVGAPVASCAVSPGWPAPVASGGVVGSGTPVLVGAWVGGGVGEGGVVATGGSELSGADPPVGGAGAVRDGRVGRAVALGVCEPAGGLACDGDRGGGRVTVIVT